MSFRSEPLKLCQIIVQKDAAFSCVVDLGQHAFLQFKDLNHRMSVFQRTYVREVRRCTELERCIQYIEKEVIDGGAGDHIPRLDYTKTEVSLQREMYDLETRLYDLERDIRQFLQNDAQLKRNYNDLKQCKSVYEKVEAFFRVHIENTAKTELGNDLVEINDVGTPLTPLMEQQETPWFIAGTIDTQKQHSFERVLWRACRRTAFVRTAEIDQYFEDPDTGKLISKSVFIIFFNGSKLQDIVNRVCEGFSAKQYSCPKTSKERQLALADILIRLHDLNLVIKTTERHKLQLLRGAAFELPEWMRQVRLQKCVFHTLNYFTFDTSGNFSIAECWVFERKMDTVMQILQRSVTRSGGTVKPVLNILHIDETPPTYNKTNKFTAVFQGIVDSYGIASYLEVNPAPYTIITFPFFFSCMFGDLGHGILMFLAGLYLVLRERNLEARQIRDEIFNMFFGGRYIILLMGLFSIYAGMIYNDAFAKSFNIFGSSWRNPYNNTDLQRWMHEEHLAKKEILLEILPESSYQTEIGPYFFGMDPIWNLAENKLNYLNSMKMKMSVLLGITQMTFGLCLSFQNYRFFKSFIDIYTVFIPQMLFMGCIFIYLCLQIVLKWIFFWVKETYIFGFLYPGSHCAPSLLIGLINMFMFKDRKLGFVQMDKPLGTTKLGTTRYMKRDSCFLSYWYPGQSYVEGCLVLTSVICVLIMLLGKPIHAYLLSLRSGVSEDDVELINHQNNQGKLDRHGGGGHRHGANDPFNLGDIIVYQAIHTIEFALGCVSHTASYLRLWALSLAHAQLSDVLWTMVFRVALGIDGYVGAFAVYVIFAVFATLTLGILVLMEGLSAFLHALRLHWVEFQSKFYEGGGYPFVAFSLKNALKKLCAESEVY